MVNMWFDDPDKDGYVKEMFIPKKRFVINNGKQSDQMLELYNGKKNLYSSVYWYEGEEPKPSNAYIDKIFLDFDPQPDSMKFFNDVRVVAHYLHLSNISFEIRFSGRGFHLFVAVTPMKLNNPKVAIRKWVKEIHDLTDTSSDMAVVGDLRRVTRLVGSINLKTNLYCMPISYDTLMTLPYDQICQLAKNIDNGCYTYHKGNAINLSDYDVSDEEFISTTSMNVETCTKHIVTGFPPCVQKLLQTPDLGYHERRELIIFLRDMGYDVDEVVNILSNSLSNNKFEHCVYEENQVEYLFNRSDILFSSCATQKVNGICGSSTCTGNNLYI